MMLNKGNSFYFLYLENPFKGKTSKSVVCGPLYQLPGIPVQTEILGPDQRVSVLYACDLRKGMGEVFV